MKRRLALVATAALVMAVPVLGGAAPAQADPTEPSQPDPAVAVQFDAGQIQQAVDAGEAREAAGNSTQSQQALEDQLIAESAQQGAPLADEDITVATLDNGLVELAVPETVSVTDITVNIDDTSGAQVASESQSADNAILSAGPGMGSWGNRADGQYIITVRNPAIGPSNVIGTGTFLWAREKYTNDGNGTYDWWHYTRKGIGQAANVLGDNWQVKQLVVQSYPYDSIEKGLVNWTDIDPASDFNGQCSSHSFNTGVSTPVFNAGYSFTDCDGYTVWHNPQVPGSYKITMDQGNWVNEGSKAAGYSVGWKSRQGTAGSMHDYQMIWFVKTPTDTSPVGKCSTYEQDKTCE